MGHPATTSQYVQTCSAVDARLLTISPPVSVQEYKQTFEPLILEECSCHAMRGIEEGEVMQPHQAVVSAPTRKDDFLYVRVTLNAVSMPQPLFPCSRFSFVGT